jgi:hypothetical protein
MSRGRCTAAPGPPTLTPWVCFGRNFWRSRYGFYGVLELRIERLMRSGLESVSVNRAVGRLRRIKAGEVRLGG